MSAFTPKQRDAMVERVALAIAWHRLLAHERDSARSMARGIVRELDLSPASDRAVRRGLVAVVERMEQEA